MGEGPALAAAMLATSNGHRIGTFQSALDRLLRHLERQEEVPPFRITVETKHYGTFLTARPRSSTPVDDWGPPPAGAPCTCSWAWGSKDCPQHGDCPDPEASR